MLRRAIALDPGYAIAHAQLARACWVLVVQNWITRDDPLVADQMDLARRALALDGDDLDGGIDLAGKAVRLNPNSTPATTSHST